MAINFGFSNEEEQPLDQDPLVAKGAEVGLTDYLTDVPLGVAKGLSALTQGLLQLGAMPIDYLADTNLLKFIDTTFEKITPDTKTAVGDVTSLLVQFGVPYVGALKIASGMSKLKNVSQMTQLGNIVDKTGKVSRIGQAGELAKRAGYFGTMGGIVDFAVSTPEKLGTVSDMIGLTEQTDIKELSGRERASEALKGKIKFGAEGTVLGGGMTLLGPTLTLGARYGIVPAMQAVGYVGGKALNIINMPLAASINRITGNIVKPGATKKIITGIDPSTGKEILEDVAQDGSSILGEMILKGGALVDKGLTKIGAKKVIGTDPVTGRQIYQDVDWLETPLNPTWLDGVKRGIQKTSNLFKTNRGVTPEMRNAQVRQEARLAADQSTVKRYGEKLQSYAEQIADDFKITFFRDKESTIRLDSLNNKLKDYVTAVETKQADSLLKDLPRIMRKDAKNFRKKVIDIEEKYSGATAGSDVKIKGEEALNLHTYMKRMFAAFQNKDFQWNTGITRDEVIPFFKKTITDTDPTVYKKIKEEAALLVNKGVQAGKISKENIKTEIKKTTEELLNKSAEAKMLSWKNEVIKYRPDGLLETSFRNLAGMLKLKKTETGGYITEDVPGVIRRWLSIEEGRSAADLAKKEIKDYAGNIIKGDLPTYQSTALAGLAVTMNQASQVYSRRGFDEILRVGLNTKDNPNGKIYTQDRIKELNLDGAFDHKKFMNLKSINPKENKISYFASESRLFQGESKDISYFAAPELANAMVGVKETTSGLYNIPFYRQLMTIKAAAQISKTVLSPVTQIRNFTTASMFPLASGLIGGKIGFKDAWRLTGEDIFGGATTEAGKIAAIEDRIRRGIIDQNVNVQEMKRVLKSAKDGDMTFSKMMNSKVMQKFTDVYQGADNYWKIYADNFYQSAFDQSFGSAAAIMKQAKDPAFYAKTGYNNKVEQEFFKNIEDWFSTVAQQKFQKVDNLTGLRKTPLEAMQEASGYLVTNTIPTYSKVPIIIENIRNLPLGNFIAFPAEILRTSANIVSIGARELTSTNPFVRQMGARRLVGVSTVLGGLGYTVQKGAQFLTGVDNEQMQAFQRSFAPAYQKNSTLIPISSSDSEGKFKYYNFSFSNPYDALVAPANAILGAFNDGSLRQDNVTTMVMDSLFGELIGGDGKKRKGAIAEFITPFVTESIGTERITDILPIGRRGKTRNGRTIYSSLDSADDILGKSLVHVLGGLTPGAVTSAQRVWQGATGTFTDYGTQRDGAAELVALMSGMRTEESKPLASMPFILTSFNKDNQIIKGEFSKAAYSAAKSPEEKIAAFERYVLQSYDSQSKMSTTLSDAETLGVSRSDLRKSLGRLTQSQSDALLKGEMKIPTFSTEAFESMHKRLADQDPFQADKIKEQDKVVMNIFRDVQKQIKKFPLGQSVDEFKSFLRDILSPGVSESRDIIDRSVAPASRTTAPRVELPPGITGAAVNPQVVTAGQPVQTAGIMSGQQLLGLPSTRDQIKSLKIGNTSIA
jgi:hypothetical protein